MADTFSEIGALIGVWNANASDITTDPEAPEAVIAVDSVANDGGAGVVLLNPVDNDTLTLDTESGVSANLPGFRFQRRKKCALQVDLSPPVDISAGHTLCVLYNLDAVETSTYNIGIFGASSADDVTAATGLIKGDGAAASFMSCSAGWESSIADSAWGNPPQVAGTAKTFAITAGPAASSTTMYIDGAIVDGGKANIATAGEGMSRIAFGNLPNATFDAARAFPGVIGIMVAYSEALDATAIAEVHDLMMVWATTGAPPNSDEAPTINQQPEDQEVLAGETATFVSTAVGTPTPTMTWGASTDGILYQPADQVLNSAIPGGITSGQLQLPNALHSDDGKYVQMVASNDVNPDATSSPALLTVTLPPDAPTATFFGPVLSSDTEADLKWQISDAVDTTWYDVDDVTSGLESRGIQYSLETVVPDGQSESQPGNQLNIDSATVAQTVYLQCKATTDYDEITSNPNTLIIEAAS